MQTFQQKESFCTVILLIWLLKLHSCVFVNLMERVAAQFVAPWAKNPAWEGQYPYLSIHPAGTTSMNTGANTLARTEGTKRTGKPVFGVKAFSPLLCILEVPSKVLLDYMHLVLAGEFLRRFNIWLDHQSDNGFQSQSKDEVDAALLNVKFPHDFHRKLRSINELKRWKNRELQNFFLHASLPILKTFFPDDYFCHFALVVDR